jgi:hypothetical protein
MPGAPQFIDYTDQAQAAWFNIAGAHGHTLQLSARVAIAVSGGQLRHMGGGFRSVGRAEPGSPISGWSTSHQQK